jgi:hypothetical protein
MFISSDKRTNNISVRRISKSLSVIDSEAFFGKPHTDAGDEKR